MRLENWWVPILLLAGCAETEWPRWRGLDGNAISRESRLPGRWTPSENVAWKVTIPGEGSSSPIVWGDCVFVTSALEDGTRRIVHCLDRRTGETQWSRETKDENPERTSALTGHAAATPVTDGVHLVAFFGNAGVVCYDFAGTLLWRKELGSFESELGLASSPILHKDLVILVCDHDGSQPRSFDSFLIALDLKGRIRWKSNREGLERSWSTPIIAAGELVVNAQDELRGYVPETGRMLWKVEGMSGWVTPSPVFGNGLIFATSGKDGPTVAVRTGGQVVWRVPSGGPYVCSPLLYGDLLYVHDERGNLVCREAGTGRPVYEERLRGKFTASGVAGDGKIYLTNEEGVTSVIRPGRAFHVVSENRLDEEVLASPAVSRGQLFIRTRRHLYCIGSK